MATYNFASITTDQAAAFTASDVLEFSDISATDVRVQPTATGTQFISGDRVVEVPVLLGALVGNANTSWVQFTDGSVLAVGDLSGNADLANIANTQTLPNADTQYWGLGGADTITAGTGTYVIYGNQGADSVIGAAGGDGDTVFGGQDGDSLNYAASTEANLLYGNLGNDTLTGGAGNDTVYGGQGDDSIVGGAGTNELWGNLGADTITGAGDSVIYGNQGDDVLISSGDDTLYGGQDNDTATLTGTGAVVYGNLGADTLDGSGAAGANVMFGGQGDDVLIGGAGGDSLYGNLGADTITGGAGANLLDGGEGDDAFVFTTGTGGTDTVLGGDGFDVLVLDNATAGAAGTFTFGNTVISVEGARILTGEAGAGGEVTADFSAIENALAITIEGDDGAVVTGTAGADTITAGAGADTIIGAANQGVDMVFDFNVNGDFIDTGAVPASVLEADSANVATGALASGDVVALQTGADTELWLATGAISAGGTVSQAAASGDLVKIMVLVGVTNNDITTADFV